MYKVHGIDSKGLPTIIIGITDEDQKTLDTGELSVLTLKVELITGDIVPIQAMFIRGKTSEDIQEKVRPYVRLQGGVLEEVVYEASPDEDKVDISGKTEDMRNFRDWHKSQKI